MPTSARKAVMDEKFAEILTKTELYYSITATPSTLCHCHIDMINDQDMPGGALETARVWWRVGLFTARVAEG